MNVLGRLSGVVNNPGSVTVSHDIPKI